MLLLERARGCYGGSVGSGLARVRRKGFGDADSGPLLLLLLRLGADRSWRRRLSS